MNTLNRAITAHFFNATGTTDDTALRKHWSALVNSERKRELAAAHHLLYLALLGKDWRKAFTPITNRRKLDNGAFYGWELFRALRQLHTRMNQEFLLAPFDGLVTLEALQRVALLVPAEGPYRYSPEAFEGGAFPFDAYHSSPLGVYQHPL